MSKEDRAEKTYEKFNRMERREWNESRRIWKIVVASVLDIAPCYKDKLIVEIKARKRISRRKIEDDLRHLSIMNLIRIDPEDGVYITDKGKNYLPSVLKE